MSAPTPETESTFPLPEIDERGVDRSQIRRMLALTPEERLQLLESAVASMMAIRGEASAVPGNPTPSS